MKPSLLVVDDQLRYLTKAEEFFRHHGYHVATAQDGSTAGELLRQQAFQAIVLDIDLGKEDGLDLLPQFREAYPSLPIIMLTGMGYDEDLLQEALRNGADGYVSKILPLEQLLMEIHRVVRFADHLAAEPTR